MIEVGPVEYILMAAFSAYGAWRFGWFLRWALFRDKRRLVNWPGARN